MAFLDESALQLVPNKRRVINTRTVRYRETEQRPRRRSQPIFGFMALNGNDVAMLTEECKSKDMISFLELVRSDNPFGHICVILDNARIHIASAVKKRAAELEIILIYLPPYSPDLNPQEQCWKPGRKRLSNRFVPSLTAMKYQLSVEFNKPSFMPKTFDYLSN